MVRVHNGPLISEELFNNIILRVLVLMAALCIWNALEKDRNLHTPLRVSIIGSTPVCETGNGCANQPPGTIN